MSLIKFNNRRRLFPWSNDGLNDFFSSNDFFNDDFIAKEEVLPAMNIKELDNKFEIEFAAPGFSKEDFEVTVNDNVLNVSGEKKIEKESKEDNFTRKEFNYNSFKRSLLLPETIDVDKDISASYLDGILQLHLSKKEGVNEVSEKIIKVT